MSLHTGGKVAELERAIINPSNLQIIAYEVKGPLLSERPSFLRIADIREIGPIGVIIDGSDELIGLDDVIKVKELYELNFNLMDLAVFDEHKHKLGKIENYSLDADTFMIHKLHIKRGMLRSLTDTGMLIDRSQIVTINRHSIIVKSTAKKVAEQKVAPEIELDYVNPFRQSSPQPES